MKQRITILSFAVIILMGGVFSDFSYTYAGTEATEQSKKKKTTVKKTQSNSSFGQAFREAKKKGQQSFKWNGKSYTTEKKSPKQTTSASKKTTTNKQTSASYTGVSFGKAYKDAKKKGISEFKWNGKSFTTGTVQKTSNKKVTNKKNITSKKKNVTNKKKNITSKKKSVTNKKKNITSKKKVTTKKKNITKRKTTPKRTYTSRTNTSPGVYTPPPNYGNTNTGTREYKRENTSGNENFRKEPKRD